ncbi:MAG: flavodoxin family protein [Oscillospiraceae bacterium]|nr:flavodoxin family protein [Oscillospiraceae bacterium]
MKILILNGSPKREKSDTLRITRAFVDGMNAAAENEVKTVHVIDRDIRYCIGCFACKKNGGRCVIEDDMQEILADILNSDVVIYSFPLYSYAMPAQLKALVDRTMPLSSWRMVRNEEGKYGHRYQYDVAGIRYVMICGCGYPNSRHNFEGVVRQFELKYPENRTIVTVPESPMFNIPQAAQFVAPRLEQLRAAGAEYASAGTLSEETLKTICSPMIPEEIYAQFANGERR